MAAVCRAAGRVRRWLVEGERRNGALGVGLRVLEVGVEDGAGGMDPWRLTVVIDAVGGVGRVPTGFSVAALLEAERGVVAEMATAGCVVFACGIGTTMEDADRLVDALAWFCGFVDEDEVLEYVDVVAKVGCDDDDDDEEGEEEDVGQRTTCPRDAYVARHAPVPRAAACGRTAAETITVYPPGIPLICVGDTIRRGVLERLVFQMQSGASITGAADPTLRTVLCVAVDDDDDIDDE